MKQTNFVKKITSFSAILLLSSNLSAQCSIDGLDSIYCSDGATAIISGVPSGGTFSGPGITGDVFDPIAAGSGDHVITYNYYDEKDVYYLRAAVGEPWSSPTNVNAMDVVFGAGEWSLGEFETVDPAVVFSDETGFVYIDGSDNGSAELATFLASNISAMEAWVQNGGKLLMNAAPNEGADITFGFGGTILEFDSPSGSVDVVDVEHPAFVGPLSPTAVTMTGSSYSHAHINGTGFSNILVNSTDASNIVLCEKSWGVGHVMFGGMTTYNFHSPATESQNWRTNLISYMYNYAGRVYLRASVAEPWGSASNVEAMDLAFGSGQWDMEFFETTDAEAVFSSATSFVYIDGSDNGALELNDFLTDNLELVENWVNDGGMLLMNAGPNEGGDMDFGFDGSMLMYDSPSGSVDVVDVAHPAFVGPNSPTASTMTGSSYSHAHITGTGFTNVLVNSTDATNVVLCEKTWGNGAVMLGGMTTNNFHLPAIESANWRANLLVYLSDSYEDFQCTAEQDVTVLNPISIDYTVGDEMFGTDGGIDISVTGGLPGYVYDWDNDGTGDFDDSEDLVDVVSGDYVVVVEDSWGCIAAATIFVDSQVGIVEQQQLDIKLYPNPTAGATILELEGEYTYELLDLNGKIVLKGNAVGKETLELSVLENGVYFINVTSNQMVQTLKIVKK